MSTAKQPNNEYIKIKGARVHNLKNIDLEIPRDKLVVFTGLSGSGKSSLAFDTIFAEGQRRYIESLSPYARQFLGQMEKPDVDEITGLSPAISIDQKAHSHNPRSTVATLTEIYDYMRVLFARIGRPYCPQCGRHIQKMSADEMRDTIVCHANEGNNKQEIKNNKVEYVTILAPVVRGRKGEYFQLLQDLYAEGFLEVRIDGAYYSLNEKIDLKRYHAHNIDVIVDRVWLFDPSTEFGANKQRLSEAIETALRKGKGLVTAIFDAKRHFERNVNRVVKGSSMQKKDSSAAPQSNSAPELLLSSHWSCPHDGFAFPEIEPRLFSFNSPHGACETCFGIGHNYHDLTQICVACKGARLKPETLAIKIFHYTIAEVTSLSIEDAYEFFGTLSKQLTENENIIAQNLIKEIISRLDFLLEVGIDYITLDREAGTLSGGESQRIRLASQIGSKLSGTLYVLDEPTIGLHERDNERLLKILKNLRDLGNSLIIVEHDEQVIRAADYLIDIGPGPGRHGGEIVVAGPAETLLSESLRATRSNFGTIAARSSRTSGDRDDMVGKIVGNPKNSPTLQYLHGEEEIPIPESRRKENKGYIKIIGARSNNIKNLDVEMPLGRLACVTGVSGSGKSTLLENIVYRNVMLRTSGFKTLENISKIFGTEYIKRIIKIDQSPIGRTPRSNPATYTGIFTPIRDLFASLEEARARGYRSGRFSFNVPPTNGGGRCEACQGAGVKIVEMHFLPDVEVRCDVCQGKRFNNETLEVKFKEKNISDVLNLTVEEAYELFGEIYHIADKLKTLKDVGLDYITLGQSATTLSGGEAQRIKLSKELSRPLARNVVFILDEPTTGLHYHDVRLLLEVLQKLVDKGNTVLLIEHNMHVIKTVDYIIDMGPEGGERGGKIIAQGTPEDIARNKHSVTGKYLKSYLK